MHENAMIVLETPKEEIGHFIRLAISLSIVSNKPIHVQKVRLEEERKGLSKSDISYIKILAQISSAVTTGVQIGSEEFTFEPKELRTNNIAINLAHPTLVSAFLPFVMMIYRNSNVKVRISGPTNKEDKITVDYIKNVIVPMLDKIGIKQKIDIIKRGYHQEIGSVILTTKASKNVNSVNIVSTGELERIYATVHSYGHKESVNFYMLEGALKRLKQSSLKIHKYENLFLENREKYKGYGVDLYAIYENSIVGANYNSIKKQVVQVGKEAADRLVSIIEKKIPFDKHSSNIIIPFLAISRDESNIFIPKKDSFIDIDTSLCTSILNTNFELTPKDNGMLVRISPSKKD